MRGILFVVVLVVVAAVLVLAFVTRRADRATGEGPGSGARRATSFGPETLDAPVRQEVGALVRQGRKIQAVKLVRERTGLGLRDAWDLVESLAAGLPQAATPLPVRPTRTTGVEALGPDLVAELRALKARDQEIAAIKLLREHTGMGLRDAKDAVDDL